MVHLMEEVVAVHLVEAVAVVRRMVEVEVEVVVVVRQMVEVEVVLLPDLVESEVVEH